MKRETLFLKAVIFLMALPILAGCIFVVPPLSTIAADINPFLQYLFLIIVYATAIVYFVALYQTLKILSYIDQNIAFSELSVKTLKNIKYCALIILSLYVLCMPIIYLMADLDDAPGLILIVMVIVFGSLVIAVFAAVLQKLLQNAIDIKSENDLTV
jgi:DMSO reductase anchor subunit